MKVGTGDPVGCLWSVAQSPARSQQLIVHHRGWYRVQSHNIIDDLDEGTECKICVQKLQQNDTKLREVADIPESHATIQRVLNRLKK